MLYYIARAGDVHSIGKNDATNGCEITLKINIPNRPALEHATKHGIAGNRGDTAWPKDFLRPKVARPPTHYACNACSNASHRKA